jgi:hypothetical protein
LDGKVGLYRRHSLNPRYLDQIWVYERCARRKLRTERCAPKVAHDETCARKDAHKKVTHDESCARESCARESYARRIMRTIYILTHIYKETKRKLKHRLVRSFYFVLLNLVSNPHRNIIDHITALADNITLNWIFWFEIWTLSSNIVSIFMDVIINPCFCVLFINLNISI